MVVSKCEYGSMGHQFGVNISIYAHIHATSSRTVAGNNLNLYICNVKSKRPMEWINNTGDLVSAYICLTVIVTGLVCAAVRWFHMCEPFRHDPGRYYPARAIVTVYFLSQLLFVPFVLRPSGPETVMYAKTLPLILVTTFVPLCLGRFFGIGKFSFRSVRSLLYISPLCLLGIAGIALIFGADNALTGNRTAFLVFFGVCAVMLTAVMIGMMTWISRRIDRYNMDSCSNEDDFPVKFASMIRLGAWGMTMLYWGVFLAPGRILLCVSWVTFAIFSVVYTIAILDPQRGKIAGVIHHAGEASAPDERTDGEAAADMPPAAEAFSEEIRLRVIALVHKNYLDPHVTRRDIISQLDYGHRTEAGSVITHYGFYEMVNTVRLEHARLYMQTHPNETLESVAVNSGFKDRFAMRHAAKKISKPNKDLLAGFTPLSSI